MRITIAAVGRMKTGPEKALYDDYLKRLPWKVQLKEIEVKSALPAPRRQREEGIALLAAAPAGARKVLLDGRGKPLSSEEFARLLDAWRGRGEPDAAFLIGGADGHDAATQQEADFMLSLGAMTWPHMLARVMLAEQIYRAWSILEGRPYHRS